MFGRRYVSTSYLHEQLANNIKRVKQIAELQSRMVLQNLTNYQLMDQMACLQSQNQLLKKRLYAREVPAERLQAPECRAIDRASHYLSHKKHYKPRVPACTPVNNDCNNHDELFVCSNRHKACQSTFENKAQSRIYQQTPGEAIALSKNVYVDPDQTKEKVSSPLSKNNNKMQTVTFKKEGETNKSQKLDLRDKFPSRVNQFKSHSAHKRFEDCDLSQSKIQKSNAFQRWNSQALMNMQSDAMFKFDQSARKKRKTFLSVVSHSSVFKKN